MHVLLAYVPVLHEGYRQFFEKHAGPKKLYIFGPEITQDFPWLSKEIRQLDPLLIKKAIEAWNIFESVEILDKTNVEGVQAGTLIFPDEDVSRQVAATYFPNIQAAFDPIFLRWDKHNSLAEKPVIPDERITRDELSRQFIKVLEVEAAKSSDIWRMVGAAVVRDGEIVLVSHNEHLPNQHTPFINGDPRNNFHKGDHIEISSALHAEAGLIAEAAEKGVSLKNADMYVTVFPCPPCAKLIAASGIQAIYCGGGYGVLDGEDILKAKGIKIMYVE